MKIGRLEKVDLRAIWKHEANDFTPWLAREENIALLSEETGLDLELISEERQVGPFRADILCKNTIDNTFVLIENQLERTDHSHLGQLLTYAAGLEAVHIIWIAQKFTEEHRAALDWLNRVTDENLRFFGIEIEVYRIGDSPPAPMFQLISKPNDWSKAVHSSAKTEELTEAKALNLEYWTAMKEYFERAGTKLRNQKPLPQHWTNFAIGRSHFKLCAVASVRDNFIRVEFDLEGQQANEHFSRLKEEFEQSSYEELDRGVQWESPDDKMGCWVTLRKTTNVLDRNDWPNQFQWFMTNLERFDAFFRPKIKKLP